MSIPGDKIGGEYGPMRANIDVERLEAYFVTHVKAIRTPVDVKQFKSGQSNPTYFMTDVASRRFVLRKKPAGQLVSSTAHQVEREYTVLRTLHRHNTSPSTPPDRRVPIPEPIILCEDMEIIGTPFYVMEFLEGRIFTDVRMLEVSPETRHECWLSAIRALAALSSLSPGELGLSSFGPSTPYFPRQIKSLSRVSAAQAAVTDIDTHTRVGDIPRFGHLIAWYQKNAPDESKTGQRVVHGDYKLDNLVFHATENRVIGILDWELCTLGSPLADLANLTQPWALERGSLPMSGGALAGFKDADDASISLETLEREYSRLTGWPYPIKGMAFARSWMLFRLAVIAQGIAARHARRQASSEKAHLYAQIFPLIGRLAWRAAEEGEARARL